MNTKMNEKQNFQELANWVIDQTKKTGAEECRVRISRRRFVEINYRERKPEVIKEATTQSLNLEVFTNKRYAGQSTPDFRKSTLEGFIRDVIENAQIVEEDPFRTLPDPKYYAGAVTQDLMLSDPSHASYTPEERHQQVQAVEDACLKNGGDNVISAEAGEYDHNYEELTKSSNGFEGYKNDTVYWTGASLTLQDEGDRRPDSYYWVGCRYRNDFPPLEEIGLKAAQRTREKMGGKKMPTETLPVIIENQCASRLMYDVLEAMTGRNIQQKRSFLGDKKGTRIGSKLLTLIDDPFIPKGLGSRYFDDDGFPAKRREMVTQGVLNDYFIDWYYSRKLGCEPTTSSPANLILPPGNRSLETITKEIGRCILITDFIGGNSNSATGDFSVGIIGKLIDKGQVVNAVAEMNIADNHLNFWNKLREVGNDPWVYDNVRLPSLVFDNIVVSGL